MDLFKRFGCNHTQSRLQRQPISKQSFNLGLPGLNPIVSINGPQANYVYYCPTCQSKLPLSENSRWEALYSASNPKPATPTQPATRAKAKSSSTSSGKYQRQPIGAKLRYDILTRDNHRCVKCGASGKEAQLEIDHKTPVSHGGTSDPTNLQTLCKRCNLGKGARKG